LSERTSGPAETEAIGARLAEGLGSGDIVLVAGEVGSGKTTLIRGACRALGVTVPVTSPTFTVGQRYPAGELTVSHLDLYRLGGLEAEEPGLLDDYLRPDSIAFVEWPGEVEAGGWVPEAPGDVRVAARVELRHAGGDRREIEVKA
jgi:tRNA threonylcarbamoyladenosine biosynthesis protein TsaE